MCEVILTRRRDKTLNKKKNENFTYCLKKVNKQNGKTIIFNSFYDRFADAVEAMVGHTRVSMG